MAFRQIGYPLRQSFRQALLAQAHKPSKTRVTRGFRWRVSLQKQAVLQAPSHNALSRACWAAASLIASGIVAVRGDGFSGRFVRCKRDRLAVTHGPRGSASRNRRRLREIRTVDPRPASPPQKSTNRPPYGGFRGSSIASVSPGPIRRLKTLCQGLLVRR